MKRVLEFYRDCTDRGLVGCVEPQHAGEQRDDPESGRTADQLEYRCFEIFAKPVADFCRRRISAHGVPHQPIMDLPVDDVDRSDSSTAA